MFITDIFYYSLVDDDIDGIPIDKLEGNASNTAGFIPSKWETVDPEQIEAQAITTSKWDTLDPVAPEPPAISNVSDDSFDSFDNGDNNRDIDEEKRNRLRDIELKTVQYQDELESGQRSLKSGWTISQQTEHYRRKLMKKSLKDLEQNIDSPSSVRRDIASTSSSLKRSPSPMEITKKPKKSKRSPSPYARTTRRKSRSRSRSPLYSKKISRDSTSPSKGTSRSAKRDRGRSHSRSYSVSPKRYIKDRHSPSPVRQSKYEVSSPRRYRYDLI